MQTCSTLPFNFFKFKVPLYLLILLAVILTSSFYYYERNVKHSVGEQVQLAAPVISSAKHFQIREKDYKYIEPLLLAEGGDDDSELVPLRQNVMDFISQQKSAGIITSASFYLRKLNDGDWVSINSDELYSPGSLMKVPTLMTYLKYAETDPKILDKEIFFKKHFGGIPEQTITGMTLTEGKNYKVRDLLYYMIAYSDNDATALLNMNIDFPLLQKFFGSLQLPIPQNDQLDYLISINDYSRFFNVLFNATYLSKNSSERAMEMLTKSAYKEGFLRELDGNLVVAHKFGERNNSGVQQLHEFGIFYIDNNPYLLGVMTKGSDHKKLPAVLSGVSKIVYDYMKALEPAS